jgi:TRAP-type C4-dicarboxylate transport system permease small subunit
MINTAFHRLDHILDLVDRLFLILANGCLTVMVVANAINILWRGILDVAIVLVWPWSMTLFVWAAFLGFFVLYRRSKDVAVLVLLRWLSLRHQRVLAVIVHLFVFSIMALMVAVAPTRIANQAGIIELVDLPRYVLSIPFFFSCFFIALNSLVQAYHVARGEAEPSSGIGYM